MIRSNRRSFLKSASIIAAGAAIGPKHLTKISIPSVPRPPFCVFTKCLQFLDYDRLGVTIAAAGYDGADLSVRKGGHVSPEKVTVDLPRAVKALAASGLKVPMMVTDITDPDDPTIARVLGTASEQGVRHYRMGYLNYDRSRSIAENLDQHKRAIEKLAQVNRKYDIHGAYQNHSGTRVGAPVWDLYWLLKDSDPAHIGMQYDIRHAVCEGGQSWPLGMELLSPWIKTTDIKDFVWENRAGKWRIQDVPLGAGMVDYDAYLAEYIRLGLGGPVSLHFEYDLGGAEAGKTNPTLSLDTISGYLKRDLRWLKEKYNAHGI